MRVLRLVLIVVIVLVAAAVYVMRDDILPSLGLAPAATPLPFVASPARTDALLQATATPPPFLVDLVTPIATPPPAAPTLTSAPATAPAATATPGALHIIIASPTKPASAPPASSATAPVVTAPATPAAPTQAAPTSTAVVTAAAQPVAAVSSGERIAFARARGDQWDIWTIKEDGSAAVQLTSGAGRDREPAWSPDGRSLAFTSGRDGNNEIYVMATDGSGLRRLTNNPANDYAPDWSPDGKYIVFVSNRDGNDEIYVMKADGSGQTRLTGSAAFDGQPAWSPDGTLIAFTSSRDRDLNIYIVPAGGGAATRLTSDAGDDRDPAWSPDGAYLAFTSDRDGQFQVYTMRADGGDQRRLTSFARGADQPTWGAPLGGRSGAGGFTLGFVAYVGDAPAGGGAELHTMRGDGSEQARLTQNDVEDADPAWYIKPAPVAFVPTPPRAPTAPAVSPTRAATATATQVSAGVEVVVDDTSPQFTRGGTARYWKEAAIGYGEHMYYTMNVRAADNWGRWTPVLPKGGTYEVFVHIPARNATTQRATYTVAHAAGQTKKTINQLQYSNEWVSLGAYKFAAQGKDYVSLSDVTTETANTRQIGFDAVKWVYKGP